MFAGALNDDWSRKTYFRREIQAQELTTDLFAVKNGKFKSLQDGISRLTFQNSDF